jgi:ABC-type multidrug transport system fused ATPase/permease subunit
VRVIRAFHQEQAEYNKFLAENEELTSLQKFAGKISGLTNPLTFIIINFAILVLIHTGAVRVSLGTLSQGQVVALYNYMSQILVELIKLANLIISVTKAMACFNRIQDVFHIEPSMKEGTKTVAAAGNTTPAVEFKNVSFTYAGGGDHAVENISFKAMPGQTIGIIGGTGSGKSTLVNLIPRFYDVSEGEVDIAGKNIQDYTYGSLRNTISVVPQKAQLFAGTIRDNLTFGCPDATEEQIEEALAISQAKEFVDTKEGRLDAKIEQGGKNLSGGQRQRLTLARALVPQSDILIMDDSASALDYATDARLRKAIQDMKRKPTVFIVSQRTSSIQNADMILVLDDGKIAGQGTHEQLLKSCNIYREIYETQFKKEEA